MMVAIRLEDIPRFENRTFSKDRILLSKVGNLDESEINKRLQSKQALSPYDKNFGKINSATVQTIDFISGAYNPSTVLRKLIRDRTNPKIQDTYNKILADNDYFNTYNDLIIAFAREHNDTVMTSDKGLQNVLDQSSYNEAINIKPSDSVTSSFTQTGQAQARARQDTERSKIAQKEEQPIQLIQEAFAEEEFLEGKSFEKQTWWVTRPSGKIEQIKVTASGKKTLESKGWIFSKDEPKPIKIEFSPEVIKIFRMINGLDFNIKAIIPKWFENNMRWVENGQISQQEFINSYNELVSSGVIIEEQKGLPEQLPDESCHDYRSRVSQAGFLVDWSNPCPEEKIPNPVDSMVSQSIGAFEICPCQEGSRLKGEILFIAENNPIWEYYYNKPLTHILQIKDIDNNVIVMKTNRLNFTLNERDERLQFDESVEFNTKVTVESIVWLSVQEPLAFSNKKIIKLEQKIEKRIDPITNQEITLCKTNGVQIIERSDWLVKVGSLLGGVLGISLLLSGVKK